MAKQRDTRPASARLILDPLEPRVLLNADTLAVQVASLPNQTQAHDLLVRMVNDTIAVGTQTQTVQRVQVVDQTSGGAILAVGDLSEIRAVAIAVTAGADKITLDIDSFGANTVPAVQLQGDGMTALAIDHAGGTTGWQANGDGSGTAAAANAAVGFTGVSALIGGAGNDVLGGPASSATWQITGPGSGSVATDAGGPATAFQGFEALAGAAGGQSTFDVLPGGAMPDGIDGGGIPFNPIVNTTAGTQIAGGHAFAAVASCAMVAGGSDALVYVGGQYGTVSDTATGANSGIVTTDGTTLSYTGMASVTLSQSVDLTLTVTDKGGTPTLTGVAGGQLQLSGPGGSTFAAPTGLLTIDLGSGGSNVFTLSGNLATLAHGLTVQTEAAGDTVNINTT